MDRPATDRSAARELLTVLVLALCALWALGQRHLLARDLGLPLARAEVAEDRAFADEDPDALDPEAADEAASAASIALSGATPGAASGSAAAISTHERILLFGDSMVEVLQPRLTDYCLENGHELRPAIWYGSTTAAWAEGGELTELLREAKPTMVIVALGSSEISSRDIDRREPFIRRIVRRIGARKLLWIGPPNWREDTGINALFARVLGDDRFFRSAELTLPRKADGIHPDAEGGALWADAFVDWVGHGSAFPIALAPPTRRAPKLPARVFAPVR